MNIYFIRHAQSVANLKRQYCGITDVELSGGGKESLYHAVEFFKDKNIESIYCSPLKRCKDTAKIIFGDHDLIIDEGIIEINFGDWEGLHISKIEEKYPNEWNKFLSDWREFKFVNGDSIPEYQKNASTEIERIINAEKSENIVIVSHHAFIKAAISYLLTSDRKLAYNLSVQNGRISQIEIIDDFRKLKLLNF